MKIERARWRRKGTADDALKQLVLEAENENEARELAELGRRMVRGQAQNGEPFRDVCYIATCRVCACTEDDCRQCIERTGTPCTWIEEDLCSACAAEDAPRKDRG